MTGRYVCHTIEFTVVYCQICILKETISRDFSKLSLDPQMDQKKQIWVKKNSNGSPAPQHNSFKTRITPKLPTAFRYLIYKHSTFLRHKVIRALPNATIL